MSAKAILFLRVSTTSQIWEQQVASVKRLAYNDGFTDNDIVTIGANESAIKLNDEERKSIQELFDYIENGVNGGYVDTVYIFEISRIARRMDVLYKVRDKLVKNKIQLKCVEPNFVLLKDDRSDIGEMANIQLALLGAMAEQEMKTKKARFAKARELKAERGEFFGGSVPLGYKTDGKGGKIIIDEEGARMVRQIFDWYEQGYSQTRIARELQNEFPNRKFMLSFVTRVLSNELYVGIVRDAGTECVSKEGKVYKTYKYKRQLPPIISREQFERCREIAKENFHQRRASKYVYYGYRLLRCPRCGGRWGVGNQRGAYYCRNAYNTQRDISNFGPIACDYKHSIGINLMDSFLWHLATILEAKYIIENDKQQRLNYAKQIKEHERQITLLERENTEHSTKIERATDAYIDGRLSKERYNTKVAEINRDIDKNNADIVQHRYHIDKLHDLINEITNKGTYTSGTGEKVVIKVKDIQQWIDTLRNTITTDEGRFELVHKHIKQVIVNVEKQGLYLTKDGVEKTAMIKEFVIDTYNGEQMKFYYVPHHDKMFDRHPSKKDKVLIEFERYNRFGQQVMERRKQKYAEKSKQYWSAFDGYYTTRQAATVLGISYKQAFELDKTYGIWRDHKGKFVIYRKEDIDKIKATESNKDGRLSSVEIRKKYKIEYNELLQIVNKGLVKADKIRNRLYIDEEDVKKYLQSKKRKGKQK